MRNLFFTPSSEAQEGLYTEYNITKTISNPRRKRRKRILLFCPDEGKKIPKSQERYYTQLLYYKVFGETNTKGVVQREEEEKSVY